MKLIKSDRYADEVALPSVRERVMRTLFAGVLGVSMLAMPAVAFAADNSASTGAQDGSGKTKFQMILKNTAEKGGFAATGDYANPDGNGDGLGDNLAFTVPSTINFVVSADGTLTGPTNACIENASAFAAHVSSMKVNPSSGWTFVEDASASDVENAVELHVGSSGDSLNAVDYVGVKSDMANPVSWNMTADDLTAGSGTDAKTLSFAGKVAHVTHDLTELTEFGETEWYVTPGEAINPFRVVYYHELCDNGWELPAIDTTIRKKPKSIDAMTGKQWESGVLFEILDEYEEMADFVTIETDIHTGDSYIVGSVNGQDKRFGGDFYYCRADGDWEQFMSDAGLTYDDLAGKTLLMIENNEPQG